MARFVLRRQDKSKRVFQTFDEIGRDLLERLSAMDDFRGADLKPLTEIFPETATAPPSLAVKVQPAVVDAIPLTSVGPDGTTLDVRTRLREKGLDLQHVVQSPAGAVGTIVAVLEDAGRVVVELRAPTGRSSSSAAAPSAATDRHEIPVGDFLRAWHKADVKTLREVQPGWPAKRWAVAEPVQAITAKARILTALAALRIVVVER